MSDPDDEDTEKFYVPKRNPDEIVVGVEGDEVFVVDPYADSSN